MDSLEANAFIEERRELDAVLASGIFGGGSNAARLLRFLCERHFEHPLEPPTEYDIGVNALGRRQDFDPRKDSVVRVETHRLRRRLNEYYGAEGGTHAVRIVIPPRQYAPQFLNLGSGPGPVLEPRPGTRSPRKLFWLLAAVVSACAFLALVYLKSSPPARPAAPAAASGPLAGDTVRILAGRPSGDYVDRMGNRWTGDAFFTGGSTATLRYYNLAQADDPAIFEHCRIGKDFSYDIPLRPGIYELRLMFAESSETVPIMGEVGDGARSFQVYANGVRILPPPDGRHRQSLDIIADAGGVDTADVKVFKDVTPAADGKLHLRFLGNKQEALVNAIEIVPGLKGRMRPLRWRAYDAPYTDHAGNLWHSDQYFRGGRFSRFHAEVSLTTDPGLYKGERFGSFTYSIPVVSGGSYAATIHFAENFYGPWATPASPPRMFNVYANHSPLLRDFDVSRTAGGPIRALTRSFRGIRPSPFDKINLCFEPITDFAIVNAIEVEDEAR